MSTQAFLATAVTPAWIFQLILMIFAFGCFLLAVFGSRWWVPGAPVYPRYGVAVAGGLAFWAAAVLVGMISAIGG